MSEATDLIKMITTVPVTVSVAGEDVVIQRIKIKHIPPVLVLCGPYYDKITKLLKDSRDFRKRVEAAVAEGKEPPTDAPFALDGVNYYKLVTDNLESVLQLIALFSGKDRAWVDELELDEAVSVFMAILEVNVDFFTQRLLPLLSEVVKEVIQPAIVALVAQQSGLMPFSSSSAVDTDTQTSLNTPMSNSSPSPMPQEGNTVND